ncbi:MAG: secretin N-terminal domain-containing protein [Planctomycetota bacterium]
MKWYPVKQASWLWLAAGCLLAACLPLQGAELPETVELPPKGLQKAPLPEMLLEDYQRRRDLASQKLQQAEILMKIGRFEDCIKLCDEILFIQRANSKARDLRSEAIQRLGSEEDANIEVERERRDRAMMTDVTRMGQIPARQPDLPRSELKAKYFERDEADTALFRQILGQKIPEINLVDTDVAYLLHLLFATHDINIIYSSQAVEGKTVTIEAKDLALGDLLKYLSSNQGLHYTYAKGVIWLYGEEDAAAGGNLFRPQVIQLKTGLSGLISATGTVEGEALSDIEALLKWMEEKWPGWPKATTWMMDRKTNRLIISSTPDIIDDVRDMVEMLDVPSTQVLISAIFLTIGEDDYNKLGFTWTLTPNPQQAADPVSGFHRRPDKITIGQAAANADVATEEMAVNALQLSVTGVLNEHQFNVTMDALKSSSSAKTMTAPRIIAKNNQVGTLNLERSYFYPTDWEVVTSQVVNDNANAIASTIVPTGWQTEMLGFELKVKPSVGGDMRTISLSLEPKIKDHDAANDTKYDIVTITDAGQELVPVTRPAFKTDTLKTEVTVLDGETVVIGGLFQDDISDTKKQVPLLSKIPGLGNLFRSRDKTRERKCLLIFVTARIVRSDNRYYADQAEPQLSAGPRQGYEGAPGRGLTPQEINRLMGDPINTE